MNDRHDRLSLSSRLVLLGAFVIAGGVLYLGFLRVFASVTSDSTPPIQTQSQTSPPTSSDPDPASSASGSIPLPPDSTGAPATDPQESSVPSVTGVSVKPEGWPSSFPDLGEHKVVSFDDGQEKRWVIDLPGGTQLAGGGFLADLQDLGWEVTTVATPNTVTSVGSKESSRASIVLRPGETGTPAGWSRMEVVYLDRVPDFELPAVTPPTDEEAARKRS